MFRLRSNAFLLTASLMLVTSSRAGQPGPILNVAPGQPGSPFVPEAGYLRTLQALDLQRRLAAGPFPNQAPTLVRPIAGTRLIPVICVQFPNRAPRFTVAQHRATLFDPPGPRPNPPLPTLTQFYRDISGGRFAPSGDVFGWFTMPQNDTYYEGANNGLNERMGELLESGMSQADAGVDFGRFDNDGADGLPNSGDDDGLVDTVFFVHPEVGGEITNVGQGNIWSHSHQYSKYRAHQGQAFVTNDRRRDAAGQATSEFIRIEDYTIQPGLSARSTGSQPRIIEIGVFCHEYGHALGLPDLYDRPNTGANSAGLGCFCLMAAGNYGADRNHSDVPVPMSAWCKAALGWADLRSITANGTIALEPVEEGNVVYNFDVPGTNGREFFLVEYRDPTWVPDPATRRNWDSGFPAGGLAIWHVDENVGRQTVDPRYKWPFAPPNQGQNDAPSLPRNPLPRFTNPHALVALMQADRQHHLEFGQDLVDGSDLHGTGSEFKDDATCVCGSRGYISGQATGFSLRGINLASGQAVVAVNDFPGGPGLAQNPPPGPGPQTAQSNAGPKLPLITANDQVVSALGKLQPLALKLAHEGGANLTDDDRKRLADATLADLKLNFAGADLNQAIRIGAAERTTVVNDRFDARSPTQEAAKALAGRSRTGSTLVRFAPTTGVEKAADLAIPTDGRSPVDDAAYRVTQDDTVRALLGPDLSFRPDPLQTSVAGNSGKVVYSQTVEVEGRAVPLSCYGVTFRYRDGLLTEINSDVLSPSSLRVTGSPDALSGEEATNLLAAQIGLPAGRIQSAERCVYLLNGQPDQARSVVKLKVDSGGKRPPIDVFLDQQTRQVLRIQ